MQTVARVGQSFDGFFECRHCELEAYATVYATAAGVARGVGEDADRLALANAESDANALASRTLQFVRCPRCGKKDPSGPSYRAQATVGAIVLGALAAGGSWLFVAMRTRGHADAGAAKWVSLAAGVFIALMLYWRWGRPWRSPDKRTVFHR
jgi:hypothetical protein